MRSKFIETWQGRKEELARRQPDHFAEFEAAHVSGDYDTANVTVGEAIGLIHDLPPAANLVERIAFEAEERITAVAYSINLSQRIECPL